MTGPRPFSTHGIALEDGIAVKRFRTNVDGDERRLYGAEPRREWRALELLARYAPGLAPKPIRAGLDADPPLIAMSAFQANHWEPAQRQRVTRLRRLFAAFWVMRLLPGGSAHRRNPPGTFERQASRLLGLLESHC